MPAKKPSLKTLITLAARCPDNQKHYLKYMVEQRKRYIEKLSSLPKTPPKIDWEFYKRNVRSEFVNMVESFEKAYNSTKIPYPDDKHSSTIDEAKQEVERLVKKFVEESNNRIEKYNEEIEYIEDLLPFNEMTWDDYITTYPDRGPDFINRPTFWPHTAEEQLGYVEVHKPHAKEEGKSEEKDEKKGKDEKKPK